MEFVKSVGLFVEIEDVCSMPEERNIKLFVVQQLLCTGKDV